MGVSTNLTLARDRAPGSPLITNVLEAFNDVILFLFLHLIEQRQHQGRVGHQGCDR